VAVPNLSAEDVSQIIADCKVVGKCNRGGQKIVYPCEINGIKYAVKFILLNYLDLDLDKDNDNDEYYIHIEEVKARAEREISIMKSLDSPYLIRIGKIDLTSTEYKNQNLLFYSEDWVEGDDISTILRKNGPMDVKDALKLSKDIATAISQIWDTNNVHRDIKPQNIMKRSSDNTYVLLDFGMAFDLDDKSLTQVGLVPGTKIYLSPEQLHWQKKRDIDFRSDLFSLGIVIYETLTGCHPFYEHGMTDLELFNRILTYTPSEPQVINTNIGKEENDIVMRLLAKEPHGRYRKCSILIKQLQAILQTMEV